MSFQSFFPDDPNDDTHPHEYYSPTSQHAVSTAVLNASPYAVPARTTWTPPDLTFLQNDTTQQQQQHQYYSQLTSALNNSAASPYPESSYAALPKLDTSALVYPHAPAAFTRYQASSSYAPYPPPYYPAPTPAPAPTFSPAQDLILLSPSAPPSPPPPAPASPQFIFEFPGGEPNDDDDPPPPPLDLSAEPDDAPAPDEMKSMMSVFRVDPFASYDGAGRRHRRRKRASTYAGTTDPAASAREPPLMFTFQLDVGPAWAGGFDDPAQQEEAAAAGVVFDGHDGAPQDFSAAYGGGGPFPADSASASTSSSYPLSSTPSPSPSPSPRPPAPPKAHVCWVCQKDFPRPSGLATHMHTHSGAKPYRCPVPACSKPFAVRSNARRHLRTHSPHALASARRRQASDSPPPPPLPFPDDVKCEALAFQFGVRERGMVHASMGGNPLVVGAY